MELHFLKSEEPLTKQFTLQPDGTYKKTSYPNAFNVNSARIEVQNIDEFHTALQSFAAQNMCLMKGELDQILDNESRAGHTLSNKPTEWVVFDLDDLSGVSTAEEFITNVLPEPFHDASYIAQLSCSSGITGSGLRMHLFFVLQDACAPAQLKRWLTECNLDTPVLRKQLRLGAGGMSLRFPLDRSVADNSKLIFVSPPVCTNFADPLAGQRITLVTKSRSNVDFKFRGSGQDIVSAKERDVIQSLRDDAGLAKKKYSTTKDGQVEVLRNADPVRVDDWWERNGFIRLNLDGGDSGAYYVVPKRPKYIHNFKGEPSLILREVAPDFWNEIKDKVGAQDMLVFRDPNTDKFFHGVYDSGEDSIEWLSPIAESHIDDWADDVFSAAPPDPIPQYFLSFDPTDRRIVDKDNRFVNLFWPTEYMRIPHSEEAKIPPTIEKVIRSVTGDDEEAYEYFLNWLAFIFQRREKTGTAIVFQGNPGTGKGVLYSRVLRKLLGQYTREINLDSIERDTFNSFLDQTLLLHVDEARANAKMRDKIFSWITDEFTMIRKAYQDQRDGRTFCNFIFASNHRDAVLIEKLDRRFTVCPWQENRLPLTEEEVHEIIPDELPRFAQFLASWEVDVARVRTPLDNAAKEDMRQDSGTSIDDFTEALNNGDLAWFLEMWQLSEGIKVNHNIGAPEAMKRWAKNVNTGEPSAVAQTEIHHVYQFIQQQEIPTAKFGHLLTKRGVDRRKTVRIEGQAVRGLMIEWKADSAELARFKELLGEAGVKAPSASDDPADRSVLSMKPKT